MKPDTVEIIAHRGASAWAPENTLAAFDLAWRQGADAIECDIHLSKDGHCVISHDETTARAAGSDLVISQHTLADLKKLDVGQWKGDCWKGQTLPSLKETLAGIPPGKRILIEVKSGLTTVPALKRDIVSSSLSLEQTAVISFNADVIAAVKREMPRVEAYLLSDLDRDPSSNMWIPASDDLLAKARACNADGLDLPACAGVNEELITRSRAAGLKIFVWAINNPAVMRQFIELNVDGITTAYPVWMRRHRQWHIAGRPFLNNGVTAHRGNPAEWPENTLPAFQSALQIGADWIELDVHCTGDNQLVVIHDTNTGRVGDANLVVSSTTYAELKKVDVARQFRGLSYETCPRTSMPLLADVLTMVKRQNKTRVSLHLSDGSAIPEICALVKCLHAEAHIGFNGSGSPEGLQQARRLLGRDAPIFWDWVDKIDLDTDIRRALENGIETIMLYYPTLTPLALDRIHKAGMLAGVWGDWPFNDMVRMRELMTMGIDRIYSDCPRLLL